MGELVILVASVVASTVIGLFVFARNPKSYINQLYGLLTLSIVLFSITNYLSLRTANRLFYTRAVVVLSAIAVAALYYLVVFITNQDKKLNRWQYVGVYYTVLVVLLGFTPLVFKGLTAGDSPVPIPNFAAALYMVQIVVFPACTLVLLAQRIRKATGVVRLQYMYMLLGVLPILLLAPVTGFIFPIILKNANFIFLSSIYAFIFVGLVGYSIVRHKLFDVRLIVVRTIAYSLTIVTVAMIYGFVAYDVVARVLFKNQQFSDSQIVVFSIMTVALVLVFPIIQKFFDRITNRLFFRDAYDSQAFLDQFNKVLVSTYDLNKLLVDGSKVIEDNFKATFCVFEIAETRYSAARLMGSPNRNALNSQTSLSIYKYLANSDLTVIAVDDLDVDGKLARIMRDNKVEVLAKLALGSSSKPIGFISLGTKKSGNLYSSQDTKVIEIIANELVIAVQNALRFEEIQNFNLTLQAKVDEATRKLRRANERLKELDESKDDFISMASHQLRTPLTSIKGYISMVLEGDAGKVTPMEREMLGQAFFSAQRMVYLIADLLNVSRLKTGKFIIEKTKVNLASIVVQELQQLKETAESRQLKLTYDKPANFPDLMLDETKTRQVIMNFVDNAIYYTPAGGHVNVRLTDTPTTVELRVEDDGIGVAKSDQPHLFTKFYRASNARKARPDGTGLGLFMAKKVIIAEEGTLIFESEEGKGSTFGFIFSKAKAGVDTSNGS